MRSSLHVLYTLFAEHAPCYGVSYAMWPVVAIHGPTTSIPESNNPGFQAY
jgi:hypothetical protein